MTTSSFARPVVLPVWIDGKQGEALVDGVEYLGYAYDGRNKVEVQPWVRGKAEDWPFALERPVGEAYWIGESHLRGLIIGANRATV